METVLFVAVVLAAGLFCPAMMWWQRRRGNDAACCAPRGRSRVSERAQPRGGAASADDLLEQQRQLATRIAELEANERAGAPR